MADGELGAEPITATANRLSSTLFRKQEKGTEARCTCCCRIAMPENLVAVTVANLVDSPAAPTPACTYYNTLDSGVL